MNYGKNNKVNLSSKTLIDNELQGTIYSQSYAYTLAQNLRKKSLYMSYRENKSLEKKFTVAVRNT